MGMRRIMSPLPVTLTVYEKIFISDGKVTEGGMELLGEKLLPLPPRQPQILRGQI
jgi:hypothetical protein